MDPSPLDKLLGDYRDRPLPQAPQNLRENVWREIRLRKNVSPTSAFDFAEFLVWVRQQMGILVAPALALALLVSIGWTEAIHQTAPAPNIQQALGLQVFSHQSSALTRLIP